MKNSLSEKGWVLLHRSILDKGYSNDPEYLALWVIIILNVAHQDKEYLFNGKIQILKRGQLLTGRQKLAKLSGINEYKVERILSCFENEQQIAQQKSNKFRLITVKNYDTYQPDCTTKCTTNAQQLHTYNELNELNKDINIYKKSKKEIYKEKREKEISKNPTDIQTSESNEVNQVITKFREIINPLLEYKNKTQRSAAEELLKRYKLEELLKIIEYVSSLKNDKYAPVITTPYQLKEKFAQLQIHYEKQRGLSSEQRLVSI